MVAASARGLGSGEAGLSSAPGDPGRTAAGLVAGGLPRLPRGLLFLGISLSPVLLFQGLYPGYIGLVLPLPKGGGEPGIQDFPGYGLGGGTQAEHQDIGMVPLPGPSGRLGIPAQCRPDP